MKILALELSSSLGSIAFRAGDETQFVRQFPADRKHSGQFYEALSALHEGCGTAETIVIGLGPGSYAGVRIAIATALGLRAASGARLIGLPSICAIDSAEYCIIGDARRGAFFFAQVRGGRYAQEPSLGTRDEVEGKINAKRDLPTFASQPLTQFDNVTLAYPSAIILARLAEQIDVGMQESLEPIYLREPYVTK